MNRRIRSGWFTCILMLGMSVVVLELDYLLPMSSILHQLLLAAGIVLLLATGATYLYQRARLTGSANAWWQDDDWTHWGGI